MEMSVSEQRVDAPVGSDASASTSIEASETVDDPAELMPETSDRSSSEGTDR